MSKPRTTHAEQAAEEFTLPDGMPYTLTMLETSQILHCGINGCYEAARRGEIPSVRIGRRIVVPTFALMAKLNGCEIAGLTETGAGHE